MQKFVLMNIVSICVGFAQTSLNMEYFGNLNQHPTVVSGGIYSACWGYTAPDGREYAILGCYNGTAIIDITDSTSLVERAFIPGVSTTWHEMKTYRHYAYVVTDGLGQGIQIIDLSNLPTSASLANTYVWTDTVSGVPTARPTAHSVSVSGNYLYLNGGTGQSIRILDL